MNYQDIAKVNSEISMIDLKGKSYAMVPERVTAFRKLYPEGFIKTEIVSHDGQTVTMQATAGYYKDGAQVILATGFAQEVKGFGMVNKTSYIENCETSAVGRALGMIGLGINGGGICSAEELVNAVTAQNQMKEEERAFCNPPIPAGGPVEKVSRLPDDAVANAFWKSMAEFKERFGISDNQDALKKFNEMRESLQAGGVIPKGKKMQNADEVNLTFDAIYANFKPSGDAA
jgi:hypothetical protein